jgi:hypothetical protein
MTHTIVTSVFPLLYSLFWLLPVWFISLVLSGVWYQVRECFLFCFVG